MTATLPLTAAATGDQLQLFRRDGGVTGQKITAVQENEGTSLLQLARDPGLKYHSDSFAVVLHRTQRCSIPLAILIVLGTAAGLGLVHGLMVTRVKLQPFVVTLCGLL
ncbi:MAG: hypothetical protein ACKPJJ_15870, partial [Planctomycetaceae bacterium]